MSVASITPHLKSINAPAAVRDLPTWLLWRYEQRPGDVKPRKVPAYSDGTPRRRHGTPDDIARLVTFEAARSAAVRRGYDGIGFATLAQFGITILDFDDVLDLSIVEPYTSGTYAEFSPSGNGVHAIYRGTLKNRKSHADDGWPFGFETFGTNGFVTFTGQPIDGSVDVVSALAPSVLELFRERFPRAQQTEERGPSDPAGHTVEEAKSWLAVLDPDMGYESWMHVGMALEAEFGGDGLALWDEWSTTGGKYPGAEALEQKWRSFGARGGITIGTLKRMAEAAGATVGAPVASASEFEDLGPGPEAPKPKAQRFEVVPAAEFVNRPPPRWIVKGVIPMADLVVLFGESGSGKSFVAIDIMMAIARGVPWRGRKVRQGRVVYVAAEGGGGFRNRLKAYAHQHNVDLSSIDFGVVHGAPNLLEKADLKALVKAIGSTEVIVFDTFAQSTPGANENAGEDMGLALANARAIGDATGATVVLIHHSGKDASKGARGWSGIRAAADAELEVLRQDEKRWVRTTKQKDGDDSDEWGFELGKVTVGQDEDGEDITSCVVLDADVPVEQDKGSRNRRPGKWETAILEAFSELSLAGESVLLPALTCLALELRPEVGGDRETKIGNVRRALKSLQAKGRLGLLGEKVFEIAD